MKNFDDNLKRQATEYPDPYTKAADLSYNLKRFYCCQYQP